jgi:hypothetical protein
MKNSFFNKSFGIGLLAGVLLMLVADVGVIFYAIEGIKNGTWEEQRGVRDVLQVVRQGLREERSVSTSGILKRVGESDFEVEANRLQGKVTLRFVYDADTVFVRLNNDDESTEVVINPTSLEVGETVAVIAGEPIGTVENQRAVKVVKY